MSDLPQTTGLQQTTDQLPDTVALEREKIALERDKLGVEKIKAKWTAISVVVTLVAAILTIAFGLWTNHQQAKIQFETKVVEILMQSTLKLVGHRQTKGTETDKPNLMLPRHISTLPQAVVQVTFVN